MHVSIIMFSFTAEVSSCFNSCLTYYYYTVIRMDCISNPIIIIIRQLIMDNNNTVYAMQASALHRMPQTSTLWPQGIT